MFCTSLLNWPDLYNEFPGTPDELKSKGCVQCLQVNDVIPILSPAVYCGFGRCGSQRFAWWHYVAEWIIELDFDHVVWL